jgi:hypothetical protein
MWSSAVRPSIVFANRQEAPMFRFGRRDERALEAVREEMTAADTRGRTVFANAMAQIESRLSIDHEATARLQASTQAAIESLRYEVVSRPAEIGPVLEQVAAMCALVAEKIEADRIERRALTEAIALLARPQPSLSEERSRVIGGTVLAPTDVSFSDDSPDREPAARELIDVGPVARTTIDLDPVDLEPVESRPVAPATLDLEPVEPRSERPVEAAAVIDLVDEEAFESTEPAPATEVWNAFEKTQFDTAGRDDAIEVRPRQGTRLTAARRSNAGATGR